MYVLISYFIFYFGLKLIGVYIVKDWNKYLMNKKLDGMCFVYLNNLKMIVLVFVLILFIL